MNPLIQLKTNPPLLIILTLLCFALLPKAQAVNPPPDGGYPGQNTAEGQQALLSLTTGLWNTALGFQALAFDTTGFSNTATGSRALFSNTTGMQNTANGAFTLVANTVGGANSAFGFNALASNTTGGANSAFGFNALASNTTSNNNTAAGAGALTNNDSSGNGTAINNTAVGGSALQANIDGARHTAVGVDALRNCIALPSTAGNTAVGTQALFSDTTGNVNTAIGDRALFSNTTGIANTAIGLHAMSSNTTGTSNTASGVSALSSNTTGNNNTGIGVDALINSTGSDNTALGTGAGGGVTTARNVICIGANVAGADADNSCYIGQIFNATSSAGSAVFINSDGKLGTATSSRRLKQEIRPMEEASEVLFALKPVTFRYKKEIDPKGTPQFGLVAEDVEKVDPDLVVRDKEGNPYSVRYDQVNAMLLNEFLKEHKAFLEEQRKVREHEAKIAQQRRDFQAAIDTLKKDMETVVARVKEQDAKLQKVSTQIEIGSGEPHVALNNR